MKYLMSVPEMKKSSTEDLIHTMKKMSTIIMEREINKPDFDLDQVLRSVLADNCYANPSTITAPFIVPENHFIIMPSVLPQKNNGVTKGDSVVPFVQLPGEQPYQAYAEDSETFVDSQTVNLRGGRSASIHRIIPGMIASFHHYTSGANGYRERQRIDATRISYDDDGQILVEKLPEEDGLFNMPMMDDE